jgi:hypothetical protein
MSSTFVSAVMPPSTLEEPVCWFLFNGYRLLVYEEAEAVRLPCLVDVAELGLSVQPSHYLGYFTDGERPRHCFTAEVDEACEAPEGMAFMGLRGAYGRLPTPLVWIGGRAVRRTPFTRNSSGLWGSEEMRLAIISSRYLPRQLCAQPRKKR